MQTLLYQEHYPLHLTIQQSGNVTFTAGGDAAGTYTDLIVVNDGDAHDEISASTYPTGFAKVFDARGNVH